MKIIFDMDGTLDDLYSVNNWLEKLRDYDASPYLDAPPLIRMSQLARAIHKAQNNGIKISIVSWLSKVSTPSYDEDVAAAKAKWLEKHLPSVIFDELHFIPYGIDKSLFADSDEDILFDDTDNVRLQFCGKAYSPEDIFNIMKGL